MLLSIHNYIALLYQCMSMCGILNLNVAHVSTLELKKEKKKQQQKTQKKRSVIFMVESRYPSQFSASESASRSGQESNWYK